MTQALRAEPLTVESIAKLEPKPGDVLVINVARRMPAERLSALHERVKGLLPDGVRAAVLEPGTRLSVASPQHNAARAR